MGLQRDKIKELEAAGYYVINLMATNKNGIPDLLALKAGELPLFVEIKEAGDTVKPLQKFRHKELIAQGFRVEIEKKD